MADSLELDRKSADRFTALIARRANHEPVAYLTGRKEFFGLEFETGAEALIPRPESEHIVETALVHVERLGDPIRIVDLGTGTGCIGLALAHELQKLRRSFALCLVDLSEKALELARRNAARHVLLEQIRLVRSNWFEALPDETFDLVLGNPPYIAEGDRALSPETAFEPAMALFAGSDGLTAYRQIIPDAYARLNAGGAIVLEMGASQGVDLTKLVLEHGIALDQLEILPDLAGQQRVLCVLK